MNRARTICWDVDTQADFMMADGKLAVGGAESLIPDLARLTTWAHDRHFTVVATADDHDIGHAEITSTPDWKTTFPPHCMRGTPGQQKIPATALHRPLVIQPVPLDPVELRAELLAHGGDLLLNKPGTDVFRWNPNAAFVLETLSPERIIVYGVATDFCTRAAVEGLARHAPQAELVVVEDAIRGIDNKESLQLVEQWRSRFRVVSTSELIA